MSILLALVSQAMHHTTVFPLSASPYWNAVYKTPDTWSISLKGSHIAALCSDLMLQIVFRQDTITFFLYTSLVFPKCYFFLRLFHNCDKEFYPFALVYLCLYSYRIHLVCTYWHDNRYNSHTSYVIPCICKTRSSHSSPFSCESCLWAVPLLRRRQNPKPTKKQKGQTLGGKPHERKLFC